MNNVLKTNICCLDLTKDCLEYLKSLDLNVYEGSLGSVYSINWQLYPGSYHNILPDTNFPPNLHEYHVFIHDMGNPTHKDYSRSDHILESIESPSVRYLICSRPISSFDLRPLGSYRIHNKLSEGTKQRRIEVIFTEREKEVEYKSDAVGYDDIKLIGNFSLYETWGILGGKKQYGERVVCEDNKFSKILFGSILDKVKYYKYYYLPTVKQGENIVVNRAYLPLLHNEDGQCVSYGFADNNDFVQFILPQVEDKAGLLKCLFENIIFHQFSDYFPDVEARSWINSDAYKQPEEIEIKRRIDVKREEYEQDISKLEEESKAVSDKNKHLKQLLTESGSALVKAVKSFLEWLGFDNVIDKDENLKEGEFKEEDLCFDYEGTHVFMEVKGINGTSTDAECSQVDKIVSRRMRALKTTDVHGVYVVNHQRNVEPLKRQMPPFNVNQIKDAENLSRTLVYTAQLFALHSDIENGYITKEQAMQALFQNGLTNFHCHLASLGVPYNYFQEDTVICLNLQDTKISVGDTLFYKDPLQRLVGLKVVSLQQEKQSFESVASGRTGIKVDVRVPRNRNIYRINTE